MLNLEQVESILRAIRQVKIAVYGDFCIDAYWMLDSEGSEISVETGLQAQAVRRHYYSLGGGANIIANAAALKPALLKVVGVIGDDIFGRELTRQLQNQPATMDLSNVIIQKENFHTVTFGKMYQDGRELPRVDFGFRNQRSPQTQERLLAALRDALETTDALIFNEQVPGSLSDEHFIASINALFDEFTHKIILLDSRHYSDRFRTIYRKCNEIEAARLTNVRVEKSGSVSLTELKKYAKALSSESGKPVFITRGERGIMAVHNSEEHVIPGLQLLSKLDTVGAGDTTISALGLALAAGFSPADAAAFANYAAAVTVQKLFQTGTANPDEIRAVAANPNFIYQPELACDLRQARYVENSEIEMCDQDRLVKGRIRHALFDHDGTISTLRQGWETVMGPVMIQAILGDAYQHADEKLYHQVCNRVMDYIDKSTGIETILQMEQLVEMVKEFGIVPRDRILDKFGYKKIYNDALMAVVEKRLAKFSRGELALDDLTIKGSVAFLRRLRSAGITLYLVSGTDWQDVLAEAKALGYADLFDGGIYGSVGDVTKVSKKLIIKKIMDEHHLSGSELAFFGDGPVEMRECRKRNGIAVGIASDEVRRYGLNIEKRKRLISAGVQVIVPDLSQEEKLFDYLTGR